MTAVAQQAVDFAAIEREAIVRRAQERLVRIDDMRAAYRLQERGKTQREIADMLHTTQPRVHRMLKAMEARGSEEVTPEEVILRATVDRTDREVLVNDLARLSYTFTEYAPEPYDGSAPGTWDQVRVAFASGLLSEEEFERVRETVRPPLA